ncbi:MAG TPA: sulfur oxidation c-type cytochrome SoxX [Usitatibacter sp.]|nr:sulfur oxidation c-type cytochrome SoxX [Usitatibacter sp.]
MKIDKQRAVLGTALAVALAAAGCATMQQQGPDDTEKAAIALMKKDFKSHGQATVDRLNQDDVQALCTEYSGDRALPADVAKRIEQEQLATVKYPADGDYMGDWKKGEKIAQTGVGKQWSDKPNAPSGGNCYACHELTKQELSFGTVGPSLYHFGRARGFTAETQKYVYGKVYNPQAFAACSSMPRFGHSGILTEEQIKDVVALLMDPHSPVNQ